MQFAGQTTKFKEGDVVYFTDRENKTTLVQIESIGILGGKLGGFVFLYKVKDFEGNYFETLENHLSKSKKNGNI